MVCVYYSFATTEMEWLVVVDQEYNLMPTLNDFLLLATVTGTGRSKVVEQPVRILWNYVQWPAKPAISILTTETLISA